MTQFGSITCKERSALCVYVCVCSCVHVGEVLLGFLVPKGRLQREEVHFHLWMLFLGLRLGAVSSKLREKQSQWKADVDNVDERFLGPLQP